MERISIIERKDFECIRPCYYQLKVHKNEVTKIINGDKDFKEYITKSNYIFEEWKNEIKVKLLSICESTDTKELITELYQSLLNKFEKLNLVDKYDIYQVLLEYWNDVMGDDAYLISKEGFGVASQITQKFKKLKDEEKEKNKAPKVVSWDGLVIPKELIANEFFASEKKELNDLSSKIEQLSSKILEIEEDVDDESPLDDFVEKEEGKDDFKVDEEKIRDKVREIRNNITNDEIKAIEESIEFETFRVPKKQIDSFIADNPLLANCVAEGKINKKTLLERLSFLRFTLPVCDDDKEDCEALEYFLGLIDSLKETKDNQKQLSKDLDKKLEEKYAELSLEELKTLVIEKKWLNSLQKDIYLLYNSLSFELANKLMVLHDKYEFTLKEITNNIKNVEVELRELIKDLVVVTREDALEEERVLNSNKTEAIGELYQLLFEAKEEKGDKNE